MTATPEKSTTMQVDNDKPISHKVVISGISGLYPKSKNIKELSEILYNKINPVTSDDCRWKFKHPEVSNFTGKVQEFDRFDNQFFKVHYRQAYAMDPGSRKILEQTYQALYDAGVNPSSLMNKNVGVFVSSYVVDNESSSLLDRSKALWLTGYAKTMFANRISYWLGTKGPSLVYDANTSGSFEVIGQAYAAIKSGRCESAIVGGFNLCIMPHVSVVAGRCYALAPDGKTKSFDELADGCARSDAVNVLYLQKAGDAIRIYGELVDVKTEYALKLSNETDEVYGFIRDPNNTADFFKRFYQEAEVPPQAVEYIEAFGSATPEADKAELQAIDKVFCENRNDKLYVGSVLSNIGLTDAAAGIAAVTKVLLGYHHGKIASNLHCESPRKDVAGLREGRMQILREHQSTSYGYIAVNGMSITGLTCHALLKGHFKPKDPSRYKSSFPHLLTITARQDISIQSIFDDLKSRPIDPEELALFHNIHSTSVAGHLGKGYIILDTDEDQKTKSLYEVAEYRDDNHRPLWFVYSGMGSQWLGMGTQLLRIPIFAAAIERCDKVLKPNGIDIVNIITSNDKTIFDDVLNSFVGIAAIQIGLTDILTAIGLKPDKIIGHSVGELGCAYADGCLTAEEIILSAYARGRASNECITTHGAMAAIGMGYNQIKDICPPEIDVACHNSSHSCTISGPSEKIKEFVAKLVSTGVFAKEVPTSNIAYHSRYIVEAESTLEHYMSKIIKTPTLRSDKWLSTSFPQEKWDEASSKYCSSYYFINNLLSPVLFEEVSQLIPSNAVVVEIAPHGLLQAILKQSISGCANIPLMLRGHQDNAVFLLNAIGKIFLEGFYIKLQNLYPIEFPVSTGTPHLSHHVKWMHDQPIPTLTRIIYSTKKSSCCKLRITIHDDEHSYLRGNIEQGKITFPFAGALVAAWDTLCMSLNHPKKQISVQFEDVHLFSQPIIHEKRQLKLDITLNKSNGEFEVLEGKSKVATGYLTIKSENKQPFEDFESEPYYIDSSEIYEQLSMLGYSYQNEFQSIYAVNKQLTKAQLLWKNNWVTLIDGLLQLNILKRNFSSIVKPIYIKNLIIDINKHIFCLEKNSLGSMVVAAELDDVFDRTRCGGIEIRSIQFNNKTFKMPELSFKLYVPPNYSYEINKNVVKKDALKGTGMALNFENVDIIDDLKWEEIAERARSNIKVHFISVTIQDVKKIAGIIKSPNNDVGFGRDFSGITKNGDRIMGVVCNKEIETVIETLPDLIWLIPNHWTLEDAATVPLAYAQAFYCMCIKYKLKGNDKVLIHGGAGALGQAAISIALEYGCTVFTTVSEVSKKKILLKLFPKLKEEYIGCSRDSSFADMVLNATNGNGCEFVLSCVKASLKNITLKCVAFNGVAIDTVQIENNDKFKYGMYNMARAQSYKTVDFSCIFDPTNIRDINRIHSMISEGISGGWVRPLTRVTFTIDETPRLFRLLAASKHRGPVLLKLTDATTPMQTRIAYKSECSYLVLWDGEKFGLQFVDLLIKRGATKILLYCTQRSANYQLKLRFWKNLGINVQITCDEVIDFENIAKIIRAQTTAPVHGIFITSNSKFIKEIYTTLCSRTSITEMCPALKYAVIIAVDDDVKKQSDFLVKKPFQLIYLPNHKQVNWQLNASIDVFTWKNAISNAIEQAMCSGYSIVDARPYLVDLPSVTEQIAKLLDAEKAKLFAETDLTLKELLVEPVLINAIGAFLENMLHVSLAERDLIVLNRKEILKMERDRNYRSLEEKKGLDILFSYVDDDELRSTADVIAMDTLITNTTTMGQELDVESTYLCIIPGVEGHHKRFRSLCKRLKLPALVLQPGFDQPDESVQQLALRYSKVLLNKLGLKNQFVLLGYEYGVEVALELASILESKGLQGTVFCIGDDPELLRVQIEEILQEYSTEEEWKLCVALHIFSLMTNRVKPEQLPPKHYDWDRKIELMRRELKCGMRSAQYVKAVVNAACSRIFSICTYKPVPRVLQSKVVLLRTYNKSPSFFEKYSTPELIKYDLLAPLGCVLNDLRCASIINRHLPKDVLDTFDATNLCTSYAFTVSKMEVDKQ